MKKALRLIHYCVVNTAFAGLLYVGRFEQEPVQGAWNLFRFWLWFAVAISLFVPACAAVSKDVREKLKSLPVPVWVDVAYDIAIVCALACAGNFWLATGWAVQTLCLSIARYIVADSKKP